MIFTELFLKGAFLIEIQPYEDQRGFFARSWCISEFKNYGLNTNLVQCNISLNIKRGTLRGMHYQEKPYEEVKIVRCTRGSIYDVIVDLRPDSLTYKKWFGIELSAKNHTSLYIPEGFAHGFQTLEDDSEVFYQMSEYYQPGSSRGLRWDDPKIGINWPISNPILSDNDRGYEFLRGD